MVKVDPRIGAALTLVAGIAIVLSFPGPGIQAQSAPRYKFDPEWPKPLPSKWKMGGVTGLAVDRNDNVWVLNRPNDLRDLELHAELTPPTADCCVRSPSMIHIDKNGNVIGSFDAPQGHGMDVDSQGFVYIGQNTVRKYDPKSGKVVAEIARAEQPGGGGGGGSGGAAGSRTRRSRPRRERSSSSGAAAAAVLPILSCEGPGARRRRPSTRSIRRRRR